MEDLGEVVPALREELDQISGPDLLAFDRILERKLYDIDRADVQAHTDGSDDGFLYGPRVRRGGRQGVLRRGQRQAGEKKKGKEKKKGDKSNY